MKTFKGFVIGLITAGLIFSSVSYATTLIQNIEVTLNTVNLSVEGVQKAQIGESYILPNGEEVPYSISYKGTTYLPIRKAADLVNKDIVWDGNTSTINIKSKTGLGTTEQPTLTNNRSNPAKINEIVQMNSDSFMNGKSKIDLSVLEVVRGQAALDIIMKENPFNSEPEIGYEYMLVKVNVKLISSENDNPVNISSYLFEATRKDGTVYNNSVFAVIPDPLSGDMYAGAEKQGFVVFMVEKGDTPLMRAYESYQKYKWFSLTK